MEKAEEDRIKKEYTELIKSYYMSDDEYEQLSDEDKTIQDKLEEEGKGLAELQRISHIFFDTFGTESILITRDEIGDVNLDIGYNIKDSNKSNQKTTKTPTNPEEKINNFVRVRVLELNKQGKSYRKIADKIKEDLDVDISHTYVGKIIKQSV